MNLRKSLLFTAGIIIGGILLLLVQLISNKTNQSPFVSMSIVFQEAKASKKYQEELKKLEKESNSKLSDLENRIREAKSNGVSGGETDKMQQDLLVIRDRLSEEYSRKTESFEKIIWDKINVKIAQYGKEKGYDYIFGARGDGAIMYASESKDITKELIEYINK